MLLGPLGLEYQVHGDTSGGDVVLCYGDICYSTPSPDLKRTRRGLA